MQAIQASNELAGVNAAELAQTQATLVSTAQMQATGLAVQTDRRTSEDAAMLRFAEAVETRQRAQLEYVSRRPRQRCFSTCRER
jgi:hypothetical protein